MFFEGITEEDLERGGQEITLYEKGDYIVTLQNLEARHSERSKAQMITCQFGVVAKLETNSGVIIASEIHGSPIWNNFVLVKSNGGPNKVGASMFMQLVSAFTGETEVEKLKKEYDAETLEDVAERTSLLVTLQAVAYVGQRNEKDLDGKPVIRNSIGSFRPVTEVEEDALKDAEIEDVPF
jgi:mannose/fructose-specific phosphotransferase system component IIA